MKLAASSRDLLTAVMHEMGHLLGKSDVKAALSNDDLMSDRLAPGIRRNPLSARDALFAAGIGTSNHVRAGFQPAGRQYREGKLRAGL